MNTEDYNNRYKRLKHIREIFNDMRNSLHDCPDSLKSEEELEELKSVQTIFLYINGDPEYIRKIYLN